MTGLQWNWCSIRNRYERMRWAAWREAERILPDTVPVLLCAILQHTHTPIYHSTPLVLECFFYTDYRRQTYSDYSFILESTSHTHYRQQQMKTSIQVSVKRKVQPNIGKYWKIYKFGLQFVWFGISTSYYKYQRNFLFLFFFRFTAFYIQSVRESTGLTTINQYLRRQRLSIFGHIARLDPAVPANAALRLAVDTKEGRRPDPSWSRRPGRPRHTWADQVREDAGIPLSTLWSAEVAKGHGAARRSSTRRQWWWWWVIDDLARLRRAILGGAASLPTGSQGYVDPTSPNLAET